MINEEEAIPKVEAFVLLARQLEQAHRFRQNDRDPNLVQAQSNVYGSASLIKLIAHECDPDLEEPLEGGLNGGWGYSAAVSATVELLGFLKSAGDRRKILAPSGPKLAMANMHPWVFGSAGQLWDDGYHREAVTKTASAIFDLYLPTKVQMPKGTQPDAMLGKAFKGPSPS